jgi:hypothetical protein
LTHTVTALINRLPNTPAIVVNDIGDILSANTLAQELFSEFVIRDNLIRMTFLDPAARSSVAAWRAQARDALGTLRRAYQESPGDSATSALVSQLLRSSTSFRTMWVQRDWTPSGRVSRVFNHSDMGPLVVDEVALRSAAEPGRTVLVYIPAPGSSSDGALRVLGTLNSRVRTPLRLQR